MIRFFHWITAFFSNIKSKIAFYPTILSLSGLFGAFIIGHFEEKGISKNLIEHFPALMVESGDTAVTLLSALITGLISLMVFSFSMVMVLLNQAVNNYSPRLLPSLISDKVHQIILGIYLASILYLIFIVFSIHPDEENTSLPGVAVLIGVMLTVICLYAFIYFIHNISQKIQINYILDKIYALTKNRLQQLIDNDQDLKPDFPEEDGWFEYYRENSGYLQNISVPNLLNLCEQHNTRISILPVKGVFVFQGIPLFRSEKALDEKALKDILSNFIFARGELVEDNYLLGFKQITEVIVKAMSPGINDPGTALNGIDYLTELFFLRLKKKNSNLIYKNRKAYIKLSIVTFDHLLYNVMASIRTYCKQDVILVQKLLIMFEYLKVKAPVDHNYSHSIDKEVQALIDDVKSSMSNERDIQIILSQAQNRDLIVN